MKTFRLFILSIIILIPFGVANGQIFLGNNPDASFLINTANTYQYEVNAAIPDDETYQLLVARPGMTMNSSSGLISWTPASIADGGKVVVRIANTGYSKTDTMIFYVSEKPQCPSGAISYWKFDSLDNSSYPDSYGVHDVQSAPPEHPAGATGKVDDAIFITNENQGLTVADHSDFHFGSNQSFSVSCWFKNNIGDRDVTSVIIGRDEGVGFDKHHWWIGIDKDNQLYFLVRDLNYTDSIYGAHEYWYKFYENFEWHHIVCIRDASSDELRIYVDFDGSTPITGTAVVDYPGTSDYFGSTTTADLNIGFLSDNYQLDGTLDDMLVFNKALTEQEIINLYNKGNAGNPACDAGNSAPIFLSEPDTIATEEQSYSYKMVAKDFNAGDNLDYSPVNIPGWLNYNASDHTISGVPSNNDVGTMIVKVKVSDGKSEVIQQYNLNIQNVNDDPAITSSPVLTVNEEQSYLYDVDATDVDAGDVISYSLTQKPAWLSINSSTGIISGTAPANDTGSYAVTVRATDVALAYDEQSYNLDIRNVNDAPAITGQNPNPLSVSEDNQLAVTLSNIIYTDVDNVTDDISLNVLSGSNYTFTGNTITPALNYVGSLTVNIQVSDLLTSTDGAVAVNVTPINDPPVITSAPVTSVNEDELYSYNITYSDVDAGDVLTLSSVSVPSWLQLNAGQAILTGTPTNDQVGMDATATFQVKIRISDGNLDSTQTFDVTVTNINDAPEIVGQKDTLLVKANNSVTLQLNNIDVVDVDDQTADLVLTVLPGANYTIAGNEIIISSSASEGLIPVNISISDPDNATDEGIYQVRVVITGIEDMQYSSSLVHKVYPSPVADYVVFELITSNRITLQIFDAIGNLMVEEHFRGNEDKAIINTSRMSNGMYFYRASSDNQYQTGKFTVVKH